MLITRLHCKVTRRQTSLLFVETPIDKDLEVLSLGLFSSSRHGAGTFAVNILETQERLRIWQFSVNTLPLGTSALPSTSTGTSIPRALPDLLASLTFLAINTSSCRPRDEEVASVPMRPSASSAPALCLSNGHENLLIDPFSSHFLGPTGHFSGVSETERINTHSQPTRLADIP